MPFHETVTAQTIIGEQGIALITRRCLEMGFLFQPRRTDHGIDGHIELVDPRNRAFLNRTLLVRSKASNRPFPGETEDEFRYVVRDERDLCLWLGGNVPVVLVLSHPEKGEAWWVDVTSAFRAGPRATEHRRQQTDSALRPGRGTGVASVGRPGGARPTCGPASLVRAGRGE